MPRRDAAGCDNFARRLNKMKKTVLILITILTLCLFAGCGGEKSALRYPKTAPAQAPAPVR